MPCWYYDKKELKNTPSIQDGIDYLTEYRYRRQGARFIMDCGTKLGLRYDTMATGVVYFHRFYMFHSFRDFPRYVTACCCLFLAGKVEETPKKCKQIIQTARLILNDEKFAQFGKNPKEEVMTLERVLLQTIKFDLQVSHPYSFLIKYAKSLKGDNKKIESMVQMAWTFVNDSLCTTLSLQWEPEIIAIALLHLASKLSKFEIMDWYGRTSKQGRWWDMLVEDISLELLEDICHQVLDLYASENQTSGNSPSPPPPPPSINPVKKNSRSSSPLQGTVKVKKEAKKEIEKPKLDVLPPLTLEATHIPQPFPYAYPGPNPFQQYPPPPNTAYPPPPPPHQYGSYPQYPPVPNQPPPSVGKPYYPPPPPPHSYPPPTPSPQILPSKYYPPPPVP